MTADIERLATFYRDVFDATIVDVPAPPGSRAALVRLGATAAIAELEVPDSPSIVPDGDELRRGHLDHIAFDTATASQLDTIRARLVEQGASDGTVNDYGAMLSVNFIDPGGKSTEVCSLRDPTLADLHPPVPFAGVLSLLDR